MDVTEAKKLSFWVSQVCIIIATVLGVFLAASQGFRLAMEFDTIQSYKNNYYLRSSLYNELNDNIGYINDYIAIVKKGNTQAVLVVETYIWETMKYSPNTMETPEEFLKQGRRFYRDVAAVVNNPIAGAHYKASQLQLIVDKMEKDVMPLFIVDLDELRDILRTRYKIEV